VLLGEAPGAKEDETGRPFIGASGKLLSRVLAEAGIDRAGVFVSSVVKCRPEKNRTPRKSEIETCRPHVEAQLRRLSPRIIVLMGGTAIAARLGRRARGGLFDLRGRLHEPDLEQEPGATWSYLCTYHPAAALRFPNKHTASLRGDLELATKLLGAG
jgi:DNA polymerase